MSCCPYGILCHRLTPCMLVLFLSNPFCVYIYIYIYIYPHILIMITDTTLTFEFVSFIFNSEKHSNLCKHTVLRFLIHRILISSRQKQRVNMQYEWTISHKCKIIIRLDPLDGYMGVCSIEKRWRGWRYTCQNPPADMKELGGDVRPQI